MELSNTAVPRYYGQFREAVLRREIPVNEEISLEMNRIDNLVKNRNVWYDGDVVEGWIAFCEAELTLTDGSDLKLLETFKLWGEQLLGWYYFVERSIYDPKEKRYIRKLVRKRLTNKQYLIIGRGAAKTMYGSTLQNWFLNVDPETTQQVTVAPTMNLADEILSPIRTSITRARGPLFQFLTEGSLHNTLGSRVNRQRLASTKKGIENFMTGSLLSIQPMSVDKLQGRHDKFATVDEWLSGDTRENPLVALEQGCAKQHDWGIVAMSSEGTIRNGVGDTIKMELLDILRGKYPDPHTSIWYYRLDDIKEISNPRMWVKANPNLDLTVSYETYQLEVERAENSPSTRNEILAKRFGIPTEEHAYFFAYEDTKCHNRQTFWGMPCSMGGDMSLGDDFYAFTFLFPLRKGFGVKTRCYITERTLFGLDRARREKYQEFIDEDSLVILDAPVIEASTVYPDLEDYIERNDFEVRAFGFDQYNSQDFVEMWTRDHGEHCVSKVIQGARTESVPLGELKKFAEDRLLFFDQKIMEFCMGNCIALQDTNGNRKLMKRHYEEKIDAVSALLDAYVQFKLHVQEFE